VISRRSVRPREAPRALALRATFLPGGEARTAGDRCASRRPHHLRHPCGSCRSASRPSDPSRGSRSDLAAGPRPQVADLRRHVSRRPSGCRIGSRDPLRRGDPSRLSDLAASPPFRSSPAPPRVVWCRHRLSGSGASSGLSSRPVGRSERCGMYRRPQEGSSGRSRRSGCECAGQERRRKSDNVRRPRRRGRCVQPRRR
jgi:hypothetical protein